MGSTLFPENVYMIFVKIQIWGMGISDCLEIIEKEFSANQLQFLLKHIH